MNGKLKELINIRNTDKLEKLWVVGGIAFVALDPITTKIALSTGYALEANPIVNATVDPSNLIELTLIKTMLFLAAFIIWDYYPKKNNKWNKRMNIILPAYIAFISCIIVVWNIINIYLIYMWM